MSTDDKPEDDVREIFIASAKGSALRFSFEKGIIAAIGQAKMLVVLQMLTEQMYDEMGWDLKADMDKKFRSIGLEPPGPEGKPVH